MTVPLHLQRDLLVEPWTVRTDQEALASPVRTFLRTGQLLSDQRLCPTEVTLSLTRRLSLVRSQYRPFQEFDCSPYGAADVLLKVVVSLCRGCKHAVSTVGGFAREGNAP